MSTKMTGLPLRTLLDRDLYTAYGFERIAFVEGYRNFELDEVSIRGRFSRNISLAHPFVSSPMGTVTGLAIAVRAALNGGIGVLPSTFTPEEQRELVLYIKSLVIQPAITPIPFTLSLNDKIARALDTDYSNLPLTRDGSPQSEFIGTYEREDSDMRLANDQLRTRMVRRDASGVSLADIPMQDGLLDTAFLHNLMVKRGRRSLVVYNEKLWPMYLVTLKDLESNHSYRDATLDREGRLAVTCAVTKYDYEHPETLRVLIEAGADALVIDTARSSEKKVELTIQVIKQLRNELNRPCDIIAGNCASRQGARRLLELGVDGLRVGQGIGSICITPMANGVWMPQLTAVYECADEAREYGVPVCADGGLETNSDTLAVIAAGAQCVMFGSRFAGTHESPAKIVGDDWRKKRHIGMGSHEAWAESNRAIMHHSGTAIARPLVEEGAPIIVRVSGHVDRLFAEMSEGLLRSLHAIGIRNIPQSHNALWNYKGPYVILVDPSAFRVRGLHGGI
ncbi:MAG: IMP dehydrogenase [Candidatus Spechtbacteria bacterium]|nr:IMP dehydrogenase [Candidatus Spechtbacteria bacterium]